MGEPSFVFASAVAGNFLHPIGFLFDLFVECLETQQKVEQRGPACRSPPRFSLRVKYKARMKPALSG